MLGNRPSSLPIARYCSAAAILGSQHGAGRAAALSSVVHARLAGDPTWRERALLLTEEERLESETWAAPSTFTFSGREFAYQDARKEAKVALDSDGCYVEPGADDVLTEGTADMYWDCPEFDTLVLCDLKKGSRTSSGPRNLQNLFYAFALASKLKRQYVYLGIWILEEGRWWLDESPIDRHSPEGNLLLAQVLAACRNIGGEYATGPHCGGCYSRLYCKEYALPVTVATELLGPLAAGEIPTPEAAAALVDKLDAISEIIKRARDTLKAGVEQGLLTIEREGPKGTERWEAVQCNGRATADLAKLRKELGPDAERFVRKGDAYTMMKWRKV